jgi:hypothetical protein
MKYEIEDSLSISFKLHGQDNGMYNELEKSFDECVNLEIARTRISYDWLKNEMLYDWRSNYFNQWNMKNFVRILIQTIVQI